MVRCDVCGLENPEGAKFCTNCGSPLIGSDFNVSMRGLQWYYQNLRLRDMRKRLSIIIASKTILIISALCILLTALLGIVVRYSSYPLSDYQLQFYAIGICVGLTGGIFGLIAGITLRPTKSDYLWFSISGAVVEFISSVFLGTWISFTPMALFSISSIPLSFIAIILLAASGHGVPSVPVRLPEKED